MKSDEMVPISINAVLSVAPNVIKMYETQLKVGSGQIIVRHGQVEKFSGSDRGIQYISSYFNTREEGCFAKK